MFVCNSLSLSLSLSLCVFKILVGMRDDHTELVSGTLVALATLVTLLGATAVMGTNRKRLFTDVQPRKARCSSSHIFLKHFSSPWSPFLVVLIKHLVLMNR